MFHRTPALSPSYFKKYKNSKKFPCTHTQKKKMENSIWASIFLGGEKWTLHWPPKCRCGSIKKFETPTSGALFDVVIYTQQRNDHKKKKKVWYVIGYLFSLKFFPPPPLLHIINEWRIIPPVFPSRRVNHTALTFSTASRRPFFFQKKQKKKTGRGKRE